MSAAAQETGMLNNDPGTGARAGEHHSSAPITAQQTKWWRLRNWRLRYKMAAVLLVPTLAALGVGGVRVYDGLATTARMNTIVEQVELAQRTANLTHELQRERDFAVVYTTSNGADDLGDYNAQIQRVDQAVQQLEAFEGRVEDFVPEVAEAYDSATNRLDSLSALRGTINDRFTSPQALVAYGSVIDSVLQVSRSVATSSADTGVTGTARATEAIARAKEQLAQQRSILLGAALRNEFLTGQTDAIRAADAQFEAAYAEFVNAASPAQQALYSARVAGAEVDGSEQLLQTALIAAEEDRDGLGVSPQEWGAQSGVRTDLVRSVETDLLSQYHDESSELAGSAQWTMIRDAGLVILLLVLAFGVALFIARSIVRPLRTLRYGALEIAQQSLPDSITKINDNPGSAGHVSVPPVPVHSQEEIGQVARSFDAVHQQALRLASEQALLRANVNDLFVNLARRSQTLVQRQLALIDRLEQDEQDPDQLSSLFELDHLATRMRRNNENLLILGGTDLTRRMMRPVPLSEVLGAAVSEVEQYARIAVADSPDLAIQGRVVNDFVHLVAELLENATVFSNPDTEVTVRAAYRRRELVVEIRDRGVGVDSADVDEINERLTRPPEIDVAVSRRMGLFVVGQLARRHDITVELQNNGDLEGGVTATVHLSGEYVAQLTPDGPVPMPDLPRGPEERRESGSGDTGTHLGLAAAFGQGGRGGGSAEPPTERAALPTRSRPEEPAREEVPDEPAEPAPELPAEYSVRLASGSSFGATDVPQWQDEDQAPADDGVRAVDWPSEEIPEEFADSSCAAPAIGADLFRNPFEAEKTGNTPAVVDDPPGRPEPAGRSNGYQRNGQQDSVSAAGLPRRRPASAPDSDSGAAAPRPPAAADDEAKGATWDMDDAPTQRLPIYEAVLSQWFRESEGDEPDTTAAAPPPAAPRPISEEPTSTNGHRAPEPDQGETELIEATPAASSGTGQHPVLPAPEPGWGSADDGWAAAEALVQQTQQAQETTTSAGLPKRVPKSNLVPGSAAPRTEQPARPKPATPRSADAVRGRMANFQQGIRRGRHAKNDQPSSNSSRHEEQE
ncbi:nitrate- and nitrite sensing domain-containing protein [Saccharopolyspora sp. CA-218241]|uniref:sensor histidine kinase n=1 Tax=Saccharopolyspora sp. CA-218241 TaxID=3240027 RepID=UPI003D97646D